MKLIRYNQFIAENIDTSIEDSLDMYFQVLRDAGCSIHFRYELGNGTVKEWFTKDTIPRIWLDTPDAEHLVKYKVIIQYNTENTLDVKDCINRISSYLNDNEYTVTSTFQHTVPKSHKIGEPNPFDFITILEFTKDKRLNENVDITIEDDMDIYLQAFKDEGCKITINYGVLDVTNYGIKKKLTNKDGIKGRKVYGYLIDIFYDDSKFIESEKGRPSKCIDDTYINTIHDIVNRFDESLNELGFETKVTYSNIQCYINIYPKSETVSDINEGIITSIPEATSFEDELEIYIQALKDEACDVDFKYYMNISVSKTNNSTTISRDNLKVGQNINGYVIYIRPDKSDTNLKILKSFKLSTNYKSVMDIIDKMGEYVKDAGYKFTRISTSNPYKAANLFTIRINKDETK